MVGSRLPQCIITLHTLVTDQNILHGIVQSVSHVELSCDIWWWHNNGKRLLAAVYFCMKIAIVLPLLIETILNVFRIISLTQFFAHDFFLSFLCVFRNQSINSFQTSSLAHFTTSNNLF